MTSVDMCRHLSTGEVVLRHQASPTKEPTMNFSSRQEAINRQIIEVIHGTGVVADADDEYDIEAIAEVVLGDYGDGFLVKPEFGGITGDPEVDADAAANSEAFWDVVRDHTR